MKIDWDQVWLGVWESSLIMMATFMTFITPLLGFLTIISIAVITDTIYAIKSKVKKYGWGAYTSSQLFNIVPKLFFYMSTILFAYLIDLYIIEDNHIYNIPMIITKVVTMSWTYIEVKSIDERRVKNGKKSMYVCIREFMNKFKSIKKDLKSME